jgi:hypothetical protein
MRVDNAVIHDSANTPLPIKLPIPWAGNGSALFLSGFSLGAFQVYP